MTLRNQVGQLSLEVEELKKQREELRRLNAVLESEATRRRKELRDARAKVGSLETDLEDEKVEAKCARAEAEWYKGRAVSAEKKNAEWEEYKRKQQAKKHKRVVDLTGHVKVNSEPAVCAKTGQVTVTKYWYRPNSDEIVAKSTTAISAPSSSKRKAVPAHSARPLRRARS